MRTGPSIASPVRRVPGRVGACGPLAGRASSAAGVPLPSMSLPCFTGGALLDLARLGRPAVINFWSSTCGPCRHEMPALQRFATAHAGQLRRDRRRHAGPARRGCFGRHRLRGLLPGGLRPGRTAAVGLLPSGAPGNPVRRRDRRCPTAGPQRGSDRSPHWTIWSPGISGSRRDRPAGVVGAAGQSSRGRPQVRLHPLAHPGRRPTLGRTGPAGRAARHRPGPPASCSGRPPCATMPANRLSRVGLRPGRHRHDGHRAAGGATRR